MMLQEIPLLRQSETFARRLSTAVREKHANRYHAARRINWSYRFDTQFFAREQALYEKDPDRYLGNEGLTNPHAEDVWEKRLAWKNALMALAKVAMHWGFAFAGLPFRKKSQEREHSIYRKAYVDDIEAVYDQAEGGVVRGVYPFPLNPFRQARYLGYLLRNGFRFHLNGLPYSPRDLWQLLIHRRVGDLMRLESRAQIRHVRSLAKGGYRTVQVSDEFDVGSLDFTRYARRLEMKVVNSAHGVGKYLPVHAYSEFFVLTLRQSEYYEAIYPCAYVKRRLNDRLPASTDSLGASIPGTDVVLLSQHHGNDLGYIEQGEAELVSRLGSAFIHHELVRLHYKPHPNRTKSKAPPGFHLLKSVASLNGKPSTVFISQFSTSQLDPSFKGKKWLVRTLKIRPEIIFDSDEPILTVDQLILAIARTAGMPQSFE